VCTNGYASNLLPELANRVIPVKGTASSLLPPVRQPVGTPSSKIFRPLFTSYAFKFGAEGRGEYMISRQEGRREMILGGAKHVYIDDAKTWYGVYDDSEQL
jgi:glycine/D-amino acid oxidase-like deaminating enzyme